MNPLRKLREDKGWTQAELAQRMNTRQQQISSWETSPEFLRLQLRSQMRIARAFKLSYVDLLLIRREMENNNG